MNTAKINIVLHNQTVRLAVQYVPYRSHPSGKMKATITSVVPDHWAPLWDAPIKYRERARKAFYAATGLKAHEEEFKAAISMDAVAKANPRSTLWSEGGPPRAILKGCERCTGDLMWVGPGEYGDDEYRCLACGKRTLKKENVG